MEYTIMLIVAMICALGGLGIGYLVGKQQRPDDESQTPPVPAPQPRYPADTIHIWRDDDRKQLVLQIRGTRYRSMEPLPAAEQKFMGKLLNYLQKWLHIPTPTPPASEAPPPEPTPTRPQPSPAPSQPDPVEAVSTSNKSIVEQIDDILQEQLENSPLQDRGISLAQTLQGGMVIYVGLEKYEEIEAIPDKAIIAMIRSAVKTWEQQQE